MKTEERAETYWDRVDRLVREYNKPDSEMKDSEVTG